MDQSMRAAHGLDLLVDIGPPGRRGSRRQAVEDALRAAVQQGRLPPGTRLPASRELAADLGLARGTVSQAYEQLIAEGWLTARTRAGTRVAGAAAPTGPSGDPYGQAAVRPPAARHDLGPGRPDLSAFPRQEWARALRRAVLEAPVEALGYGDPRGRPELRSALAGYLGRVRGVRVDPAHLVICSGFTQAFHLLTRVLAGTGAARIGMENPAMPEHVEIARTAGLTVLDLPVDQDGPLVAPAETGGAHVVLCTPAHQFPLGVSMSPERRARLLAWADAQDGWIVEDDYDGEFRYDRRPVAALQARRPDRVAYVGSTSKSLGPSVRLGWIACPPRLLEPLVEAKRLADRQTPTLEQLALADLLTTGAFDRYLRARRRSYRQRRDTLVAAVAERLPEARVTGIAAGLHVLLEPPPHRTDQRKTAAALRRHGIALTTLDRYLRGEERPDPAPLVVGYATPAAHAYPAAVDALLTALTEAVR
ncbi:hypothetical protein BU197_28020 [Streptomyces sp. CBMA291]|nr:hypothetical protein [Streptomyces sp. CBMA291]MBD0717963.1 hypothetical protein [Streptomyces sp. CBMA370]